MKSITNFDSDVDGEFITKFFNVVQIIDDKEHTDVTHTRTVAN